MTRANTATPGAVERSGRTYSRALLAEAMPRALTFLIGVSRSVAIRRVLRERGFGEDEQREGWQRLQDCSGLFYGDDDLETDRAVELAINEVADRAKASLPVIAASLRDRFPIVARSLLEGLLDQSSGAVVATMAKLVERMRALAVAPAADPSAAVALLAKRGFDAKWISRMGELVTAAQTADAVPIDTAEREAANTAYVEALARLRDWYEEWAAIARTDIKRRDLLIRLGLARRAQNKSAKRPKPAK